LIYFRGYGGDSYEFYNLKEDPEELVDLYHANHSVAQELQVELEKKLAEADRPYRRPAGE